MASTEYRSPARAEPPRQRLTSPWTLLGIAVAVGVTLVLIFPGSCSERRGGVLTSRVPAGGIAKVEPQPRSDATRSRKGGATAQQPPREASIKYLEEQVERDPKNADLRFKLAQEETQLGHLKEARAALEPLYNSSDPAVRQRARLMDMQLQLQQLYAIPPNTPEREQAAERMRQELTAMGQYEWDNKGLTELADLAGKVGARKLRADLYLRIVRNDPKVSRKFIDEAARNVLADGQYRAAADLYFTAQARAASIDDQRRYFTSGVKALQAGNMPREAMAAADQHAGSLLNDEATLRYLIQLARASNDTRRAQSYVKRLMRMSDIGALERWLRAIAGFVISEAVAAEPEPRSPARVMKGMRPFNAEDYKLAYEVFLANRNLDDAYRVAAAAVQQRPNDMFWRERLAQISEWSGRGEEALQQWLYIARRTGRQDAWASVQRLAPGFFNDEALLEAMRYQASTRRALTDEQWRAVIDAYERVGRPREAVAMLEREYQRDRRPLYLELQATLLERTGDLDASIAAHRRLIQEAGGTTQRVSTLATLLIVRGNYKEAYDLLESWRPNVTQGDADYWKVLADLAWALQEDAGAERALDNLVASGKAVPDDFNRLIALLQPNRPELAARLAELGYQRFRTTDYLVAALGIYSERRDFLSMRRVFGVITPEVEAQLEKSPDYLMLRAEYRAATGSPQLALRDYQEALRIDPTHRYARIGYLWFLIDRRFIPELKRELQPTLKLAKDDPSYDPVLGATFLTIGDAAHATEYFARVLRRNPDDYLWLLTYADALEQNEQPDLAWRVRRHAWIKVRQEMAKGLPEDRLKRLELLQSQARLATSFFPGDASLVIMRSLLRQDGSLSGAPDARRRGIDTGARELVLAWTISTEQWVAAKAWLITQYARDLARPTWAVASIALAENDVETLQKLLDKEPEALPRYDRHEAAMRTQQYKLAEDIAFTELERRPYDDEMHLRLSEAVLPNVNSWEVGQTHFRRGVVGGRERTAEVALWLSPRLRLSFDVSHIDQGLRTPGVLASVPARDTTYGLTALFRHSVGETRISVYHRDALGEFTGARISYGRPLGPRVTGAIGLAYNDRADETTALLVGGARDRVYVSGEYTLSKREYVTGELSASRYYTQDRTFIGSGETLSWEAGHRFRTEYPDFHVRLAGSFNRFNQSGSGDQLTAALNPDGTIPTSAFFLPPNFTVYGVYTGFGTFYQTNYTRGIRPFVDVGISHNTVSGQGYGALIGASGTVFGSDRLTLYASQGRGGNGTNETSREIGLRYMHMFDRF